MKTFSLIPTQERYAKLILARPTRTAFFGAAFKRTLKRHGFDDRQAGFAWEDTKDYVKLVVTAIR